jgi:hypothetical protein
MGAKGRACHFRETLDSIDVSEHSLFETGVVTGTLNIIVRIICIDFIAIEKY